MLVYQRVMELHLPCRQTRPGNPGNPLAQWGSCSTWPFGGYTRCCPSCWRRPPHRAFRASAGGMFHENRLVIGDKKYKRYVFVHVCSIYDDDLSTENMRISLTRDACWLIHSNHRKSLGTPSGSLGGYRYVLSQMNSLFQKLRGNQLLMNEA